MRSKSNELSFEHRFFIFQADSYEESFQRVSNNQEYKDLSDQIGELCDELENILGRENMGPVNKLCDVICSRATLEIEAAYKAGMKDHMKLINLINAS